MSITKPYHRNYRAIKAGPNSVYSGVAYISDKLYAKSPQNYVRAFLLIQKDLEELFEYVEPSPESLRTYSYRIHELLMRTCIEIEANFKAILNENIYTPKRDRSGNATLNMGVYKKINITHHLSSYELNLPVYNGPTRILKPFESWKSGGSPDWYEAYNASKHDRHDEFKKANLDHLISAVAGLVAVLSSQFYDTTFTSDPVVFSVEGFDYHDMDHAIGSLFRIKYPDDWTDEEMYDFDWADLKENPDRFGKIDYNAI